MKGKRNNFKSKSLKSFVYSSLILFFLAPNPVPAFAGRINKVSAHSSEPGYNEAIRRVRSFDFDSLRLAITDLTKTFGQSYPKGQEYLEHLNSLEELSKAALSSFNRKDNSAKTALSKLAHDLNKLRYDALLSNPLLDFKRLLLLKRRQGQLGLPVNHKCNSGIERTGYDNEIAVLASVRPDGILQTLFRPSGRRFVGEMDLHFDADRLLFTMPKGNSWQIFEIKTDGSGLRQVSRTPAGLLRPRRLASQPEAVGYVDNFDACYLPDGRIVFASTASYTGVPCWFTATPANGPEQHIEHIHTKLMVACRCDSRRKTWQQVAIIQQKQAPACCRREQAGRWFAAAPGATGPKDAVPLFASVTQPGSGSITLASASYARWEW